MASSDASYPKLVCCGRVESTKKQDLYDVKFWPYTVEGEEQIFAIAGGSEVAVCRTATNADPAFEVLCWWTDTHEGSSINSIAWMQDPANGKPWLCLAGISPREIAVLDIEQERIVRSLPGHGRSINELVVSPTQPTLLASCSEDFTVRLWDLDPRYAAQPCVAILAGEAHRQPLLACAFHPNGRWILSGAMDTAVALWAVPTPDELERRADRNDEPLSVAHPHFFSTEIHHNYVDSLAFYGDLIISRCCLSQNQTAKQHEILIWKIDGFHSDQDIPRDIDIARPGVQTRSSFPHLSSTQGFQRLLTLAMPYSDRFYLRFGLFHSPGLRPLLCMGNVQSKFSFWDLQKLEHHLIRDAPPLTAGRGVAKKMPPKQKAASLGIAKSADHADSVASSTSKDEGKSFFGAFDVANAVSASPAPAPKPPRDVLSDPFQPIKPHSVVAAYTDVNKNLFATFTTSWSPDGRWVVAVGDSSTMVMMYRDKVA